jgi:hypothetical protein
MYLKFHHIHWGCMHMKATWVKIIVTPILAIDFRVRGPNEKIRFPRLTRDTHIVYPISKELPACIMADKWILPWCFPRSLLWMQVMRFPICPTVTKCNQCLKYADSLCLRKLPKEGIWFLISWFKMCIEGEQRYQLI